MLTVGILPIYNQITRLTKRKHKEVITLSLGTAIKKIRTDKGIRANYLAKHLRVSPSTISKYESNERKIKADQVPNFAAALGVTVDFIFSQNVDDSPINH